MKRLLPFMLFAFNTLYICAQHQLIMSDGTILKGEVISYSSGEIKFNMLGNTMTFNLASVSAINFSEAPLQSTKSSNIVNVHGNVQYFFNDNYGDKPDVGADIWFLSMDSLGNGIDDINSIDTLFLLNYYGIEVFWNSHLLNNTKELHPLLLKYGIESQDQFDEFQKSVSSELMQMGYHSSTIKTVADGNGTFSKSLRPGTYIVVIKSKHRDALNYVDHGGEVIIRAVEIDQGFSEFEINAHYGLYSSKYTGQGN